jgi:hypothetical protein
MTVTLPQVLLVCALGVGCVAPKRANLIIPGRCVRVKAESFTRPCVPRPDGKLVCDGVVISATCSGVKQ